LKIFLSFFQSLKKHPIPAYDFWQYYLKNGIEEAGHEWAECPGVDWAYGLLLHNKPGFEEWQKETWDKTIDWLKKNPVDLFLSYLYPHMVSMDAVREIKSTGIPCVNFFCDHLRDFKKLPSSLSVFDLNWVPEYKAIKLYQDAGYSHINLPMPIWVEPKLRVLQNENNQQITFIGSKDIQRQKLLEDIVAHSPDIALTVYGRGWQEGTAIPKPATAYTLSDKLQYQLKFIKTQGPAAYLRKLNSKQHATPISDQLKQKIHGLPDFEQYNKLTSCSMVTVGVNRYPSFHYPFFKPDSYSRLRDIEAPMLGACYLTEWTEGIDKLYETGSEIETYKNAEEFVEKVKELQADPVKRKTLRVNGQKRALEMHNIPSSLNSIICALNL